MTNIFDNLGKGLNDLANRAGDVAGKAGGNAGRMAKELAEQAGQTAKAVGDKAAEAAGDAAKAAAKLGVDPGKAVDIAGKAVDKTAKDTKRLAEGIAGGAKESVDRIDLFNSRLRQQAVDDYNHAVERYEKVAGDLSSNTKVLYDLRRIAVVHVKYVEQHINQLANTPKEFSVDLKRIGVEVETFEGKESEIRQAEHQAKAAEGGSGAGATLGALGLAVATMGPTAAMGVATTFGVASTAPPSPRCREPPRTARRWRGWAEAPWPREAAACPREPTTAYSPETRSCRPDCSSTRR